VWCSGKVLFENLHIPQRILAYQSKATAKAIVNDVFDIKEYETTTYSRKILQKLLVRLVIDNSGNSNTFACCPRSDIIWRNQPTHFGDATIIMVFWTFVYFIIHHQISRNWTGIKQLLYAELACWILRTMYRTPLQSSHLRTNDFMPTKNTYYILSLIAYSTMNGK
jgi:hypothetical protein